MGFTQRHIFISFISFFALVAEVATAQDPRPSTVAGQYLGAENLFQTQVPHDHVLVLKLTENLRILKFPDGSSFVLETVPGGASVLVSHAQASVVMSYPGGKGGLAEFSADQLSRFEAKLEEAVDADALTDISEFDPKLDSAKSNRFFTFNTSSSQHWEGLVYFGMISGALINTFGFKLLASGIFDKGPEFSRHAMTAGVVATILMTAPMAIVLRKQATKGPVKPWKRLVTAAVVAGGLGVCAGALGLIGSAFGR